LHQLGSFQAPEAGVQMAREVEAASPAFDAAITNFQAVSSALGHRPGITDSVRAFRTFDGDTFAAAADGMKKINALTPVLADAVATDLDTYNALRSSGIKNAILAGGGYAAAVIGGGLVAGSFYFD
jgi:hypothetical protein